MRKSEFTIESKPESIFNGFTEGASWNGWACPYFTFEEASKIVDAHNQTGQKAVFDDDGDVFIFEFPGDEKEFYVGLEIEGQKLYPIGNSNWIWEEVDI